jgi:tRNA U34 5-carboxymethylaminomethyl modifying GTPase MnmE/TrmE
VWMLPMSKKSFLAILHCGNIRAMHEQDTICAVSTPPGEGGIGIIRISGSDAVAVSSRVFKPRRGADIALAASHSLHYGHVVIGFG